MVSPLTAGWALRGPGGRLLGLQEGNLPRRLGVSAHEHLQCWVKICFKGGTEVERVPPLPSKEASTRGSPEAARALGRTRIRWTPLAFGVGFSHLPALLPPCSQVPGQPGSRFLGATRAGCVCILPQGRLCQRAKLLPQAPASRFFSPSRNPRLSRSEFAAPKKEGRASRGPE